jgi:hypothetical protein
MFQQSMTFLHLLWSWSCRGQLTEQRAREGLSNCSVLATPRSAPQEAMRASFVSEGTTRESIDSCEGASERVRGKKRNYLTARDT